MNTTRFRILALPILSSMLLVSCLSEIEAKPGGGGHPPGGFGGGAGRGVVAPRYACGRGYYGRGGYWGGGFYPGYYGLGLGLGMGLGLGYGYGYGYPYYDPYYDPYYGYGYPVVIRPAPTQVIVANPQTPSDIGLAPGPYAQPTQASAQANAKEIAPAEIQPAVAKGPPSGNGVSTLTDVDVLLIIRVPGSAIVKINGQTTSQIGPRREFISSGLVPGKTYTFVLTAQWDEGNGKSVNLQRQVKVQGGERRSVDFTQPQPIE